MIEYVDQMCKQWAEHICGGYPVLSRRSIFEPRLTAGVAADNEEVWDVEFIVTVMPRPWRTVVYVHYLRADESVDERIAAARMVHDTAPPFLRGSAKAREHREERYSMGRKKYYALLHQAHLVIDRELKAKHRKIS